MLKNLAGIISNLFQIQFGLETHIDDYVVVEYDKKLLKTIQKIPKYKKYYQKIRRADN